MPKLYVELEIEVSGTVTEGFPASRNDPGHASYCDDADIDSVTFEYGGKVYDLLEGLDPIAKRQVELNLNAALMDDMGQAILDEGY